MASLPAEEAPPDESIAWHLWVGVTTTAVPATIAVALRFYARRLGQIALKADDWLIVGALVRSLGVLARASPFSTDMHSYLCGPWLASATPRSSTTTSGATPTTSRIGKCKSSRRHDPSQTVCIAECHADDMTELPRHPSGLLPHRNLHSLLHTLLLPPHLHLPDVPHPRMDRHEHGGRLLRLLLHRRHLWMLACQLLLEPRPARSMHERGALLQGQRHYEPGVGSHCASAADSDVVAITNVHEEEDCSLPDLLAWTLVSFDSPLSFPPFRQPP